MKDPRETALAFLQAMWASDVATAAGLLAPDARSMLPRSMSGNERSAPAAQAIESLVNGLFSQFLSPPGLVADVRHVVADGETVLVEYEVTGTLASGAEYANDAVMSITTADGLITQMRPYGDTKYIHDMMMVEPAELSASISVTRPCAEGTER
jgi:ketosteroid isomerase-like protein